MINYCSFLFQFMSPEEAKEFGLIDKVLAQVPKPGHDDSDVSPVTEKSD